MKGQFCSELKEYFVREDWGVESKAHRKTVGACRQALSCVQRRMLQCLEGGDHRTVSDEIMFGCAD